MGTKLGITEKSRPAIRFADFGFWIECLKKTSRRLSQDIGGATAIEYGLLAGLVAVGLAGGLGALADLVNLLFDSISTETTDVAASIANP